MDCRAGRSPLGDGDAAEHRPPHQGIGDGHDHQRQIVGDDAGPESDGLRLLLAGQNSSITGRIKEERHRALLRQQRAGKTDERSGMIIAATVAPGGSGRPRVQPMKCIARRKKNAASSSGRHKIPVTASVWTG